MIIRFCLSALVVVGFASLAAAQNISPQDAAFFESKIRPALAEHCYSCHGAKKQKGDLRLDSRAAIVTGGESGPAIIPGKAAESLLLKAVRHDGELKMPPRTKLSKQTIDDLTAWVDKGAAWPGANEPKAVKRAISEVTAKDRDHWSFKPVERHTPPTGEKNAIDALIVAQLRKSGLTLSAAATPRELIRRVTFDLTGLPPTPEEVDAFVGDSSEAAYAKLVDRLLASPRYGERWARHWLDVVRFAQSHGYERDSEAQNAWRYRDYVIDSFNEDKPYDRFIREQLAGDEMEPVTDRTRIATAFYRLGVWDDEPDDQKQADFDSLDDILATTTEAFLGLTVGCARCHDHKFDPIPQEDYYSLLAFLRNIAPGRKLPLLKDPCQIPLAGGGHTLGVTEVAKAPLPTNVLAAGQVARKGKAVEPGFLRVLCSENEAARPGEIRPTAATTGRRSVLANWIASKDNPLTARTLVNRLWRWHFGRGLVDTPSDLGRNGSPPSHPELLDWLAADFVEGGWTLKRMHRQIVLSKTYRQSSANRDDAVAIDAGNVLLWRQNLRRLEAEAIRDAVLATSGSLKFTMGGRGIFPALPREVLETQSRPGLGWKASPPEEQGRRSVYIFVKRTLGVPFLESFDAASPDKSVASRTTTTIAPQALILLNSSFMEEQATAFARRVRERSDGDAEREIDAVFRIAFQRSANERERRIAREFLLQAGESERGLAGLCRLAMNLNEFLYVD